jgi:hypothetical protein
MTPSSPPTPRSRLRMGAVPPAGIVGARFEQERAGAPVKIVVLPLVLTMNHPLSLTTLVFVVVWWQAVRISAWGKALLAQLQVRRAVPIPAPQRLSWDLPPDGLSWSESLLFWADQVELLAAMQEKLR